MTNNSCGGCAQVVQSAVVATTCLAIPFPSARGNCSCSCWYADRVLDRGRGGGETQAGGLASENELMSHYSITHPHQQKQHQTRTRYRTNLTAAQVVLVKRQISLSLALRFCQKGSLCFFPLSCDDDDGQFERRSTHDG